MINIDQFHPVISVTLCLSRKSPAVQFYDPIIRYFSECLGLHIQIDGSPLSYPEFEKLLEQFSQSGIDNIGIRTSTTLTNKKLELLKSVNVRSVLFRYGMKNLDNNIKKAKKHGLSTEISLLISKDVFAELPNLLEQFEKQGIDLLVIERSIVADYWRKKVLSLDRFDYYNLLNFIIDHNRRDTKLKIAISHCPNKILLHPNDEYAKMSGGCSGGIISCAIDWNGNIIPCLPLWKLVLGNICENDFADIWNNSPVLAKLRNRDSLEGKCGACSYKISCGGCRAESYKMYKNLFMEDSTCWK